MTEAENERAAVEDDRCEFCGRDPYHWVDIGVGFERAAIVCCDEAIEAYQAARADILIRTQETDDGR